MESAPFYTLSPVEQHEGTINNVESERKERPRVGRGYILGKGVSKSDSKLQKELFCEENHIKKVVQFQNGIFPK